MLERLCIIGVGLIGGSVALAARAFGLARRIVGVDQDPKCLRQAQALGVVDAGCKSVAEGARHADGIVIAVPVGEIQKILATLAPVWSARAFYTDTGSTKVSVIEAAQAVFGKAPANFVPAHPIAGRELSGVEAAAADLFQGKRIILTPTPETDARVLEQVCGFWRGLGGEVHLMEPARHDHVLAATSHLPHVLAYALTHLLGLKDEHDEIFRYAAGGFKDFTRIASSDSKMWADICLANAGEILAWLQQFEGELAALRGMIEHADQLALRSYFTAARAARQRFLDQEQARSSCP
ncbi:hypothetical protein JCM13664_13640 [Methylothermus subterraneus]